MPGSSPGGTGGAGTGPVRRTGLPGGLRVVTEQMPGVRSASVGVWVGVGARDEPAELAGASHLLEHLLFKGTRRRDAWEIAVALDAVGGDLNAFTTREETCVHASVLAEDLALAVDVVCDLVTSCTLSAGDVAAERDVVLEEIAMNEDDPEEVAHEAFRSACFGAGTPLGRPVLGTVDSVGGLTRAALQDWHRTRYTPDRTVVAAAGRLEHDAVVDLVARAFGDRLTGPAEPAPPRPATGAPARPQAARVVRRRDVEQTSLVLGTLGLAAGDPRRPALRVLDTVLGDGASSRLFQQVREQRGLAYSVYSSTTSYADTGTLSVYAGCAPARTAQVAEVCAEVLDEASRDGLTDEEVARAQGRLRGSRLLDLEDPASRADRLGASELTHGHYRELDAVLDGLAAVTPDDVRAVAQAVLGQPRVLAVVGPPARSRPEQDGEEEVA